MGTVRMCPPLPIRSHDCPVALPHLHLIQLQANQLRSAKATTEQHGQVALGTQAIATSTLKHCRTLLRAQPIAGAKPDLLDPFYSADPRRRLKTQQPRVSGFVRQATHLRLGGMAATLETRLRQAQSEPLALST
jgi:hypothetical protein